MEPCVDASVCAAGSQKCIGKSGMLVMKARNRTANISSCVACGIWLAFTIMYCMSNECSGV